MSERGHMKSEKIHIYMAGRKLRGMPTHTCVLGEFAALAQTTFTVVLKTSVLMFGNLAFAAKF